MLIVDGLKSIHALLINANKFGTDKFISDRSKQFQRGNNRGWGKPSPNGSSSRRQIKSLGDNTDARLGAKGQDFEAGTGMNHRNHQTRCDRIQPAVQLPIFRVLHSIHFCIVYKLCMFLS